MPTRRRERTWLVTYAPPIRMRLVRRVTGPFVSTSDALAHRPPCPSPLCVGWRLLEGGTLAAARLIDEEGDLPAERTPDPTLRAADEADLLSALSAGRTDVVDRRRLRGLHRRGLVDASGLLVTPLGRRALAEYRRRGAGTG